MSTHEAKDNSRASDRFPIFQKRFNELRGDMSQEDFAKKIGISRPTVGFYENGERLPDALVLLRIAQTCGVSTDWLLGLSDDPTGNADVMAVERRIGLTPDAQQALIELKRKNKCKWWLDIVNAMLEYNDFQYIVACMTDYATSSNEKEIKPSTDTASIEPIKENDIRMFAIQKCIESMLNHFANDVGFKRRPDYRWDYVHTLYSYRDGDIDIETCRQNIEKWGFDFDEFLQDVKREVEK